LQQWFSRAVARVGQVQFGNPFTAFVPDASPPRAGLLHRVRPDRGHNFCPVPWYFAQIEPDGGVCFCGDFPDVVIGNVRQTPFAEIWRGEHAQAFRARLAAGPLAVCNRCCGLFVHGRWPRS
jgi:MoaA/NifB/PqqE/SkfB family radical SAM enzyme